MVFICDISINDAWIDVLVDGREVLCTNVLW